MKEQEAFICGVAATTAVMVLLSFVLVSFPSQYSSSLSLGEYWRTMDVVPFCQERGFQDGYVTMDIGERPRTPYIYCYSTFDNGGMSARFEIRENVVVYNATISNATW